MPWEKKKKWYRAAYLEDALAAMKVIDAAPSTADLDRDIEALIAQIGWLEDVTGESLEDEDAALLEQIQRDLELRRAAAVLRARAKMEAGG